MKRKGFMEKFFGRVKDEGEESFSDLGLAEQDMIRGVVDLAQTTVKEVMVPRIDVVFVSLDTPRDELLETLIACGHSRVPIYNGTIDNVVGVLYVKDLLTHFRKNETLEIAKIIRKPYFVPDSKRLDTLLREFKGRRIHIALAVDEYGGVSGIVCMEDIIEEIVGDIQDEFDNEAETVLEIDPATYLCDARVGIEEINKAAELSLSDEDFDTLGGFVFDKFGKIPVRYEKVETPEADFIIQEMEGHKIKTIKIVRKK